MNSAGLHQDRHDLLADRRWYAAHGLAHVWRRWMSAIVAAEGQA